MNKDMYETLTACPYCKSLDIKKLYSAPDRLTSNTGMFHLSLCRNCKLAFQNPRIKEEFIHQFYTDELGYYHATTAQKTGMSFLKRLQMKLYYETLASHFHYAHLGSDIFFWKLLTFPFTKLINVRSLPHYSNQIKILEIACSHGGFLEKLRELGWKHDQLVGLEMDEKSADMARKRGFTVHTSRIEDAGFPNDQFDVVIMNMVLEHLYHPFESLKQVSEWLKPGGELIFTIPYFESLGFRWFKKYSYGLHLPHHIIFLNEKIIIEHLKELGFKDVRFYFQANMRDIIASAGYRYAENGGRFYKLLGSSRFIKKMIVKPFVIVQSIFGKTTRVTVRALKQ